MSNTSTLIEADPKRPYKAAVALVLTFVGALWASLEGRGDTLDSMTLMEWFSVIVPTILTTGAVYGVKNPKVVTTTYVGEHVRDDRGAAPTNTIWLVLGIVGIVLIVLLLLGVL